MYDYILTYLNTFKNNKLLINKTHNNGHSVSTNSFKLKSFYLNFFFSIFNYKKKSKYIFNKTTIRNPFFINSNYINIVCNNNIFFSYNEVLNLEQLHTILKLDTPLLNCIKLEYYYKTLNVINLNFLFNFNKN
jgi:hypothetical protein